MDGPTAARAQPCPASTCLLRTPTHPPSPAFGPALGQRDSGAGETKPPGVGGSLTQEPRRPRPHPLCAHKAPPHSAAGPRHRRDPGPSGSVRCAPALVREVARQRSLGPRWAGSCGDRKDGEEGGAGFLRWKITSVRALASPRSRRGGGWGAGGARPGGAPCHLQRPGPRGALGPAGGSRGGSLQVGVQSSSESPSHGGQTADPDG